MNTVGHVTMGLLTVQGVAQLMVKGDPNLLRMYMYMWHSLVDHVVAGHLLV